MEEGERPLLQHPIGYLNTLLVDFKYKSLEMLLDVS
jgi:hypothetical protein